MGTSVLSKVGFSGRRKNRDPLASAMDAVDAGFRVTVGGFGKIRFWRKKEVDFASMTHTQKQEYVAHAMGYASYAASDIHLVDDVVGKES